MNYLCQKCKKKLRVTDFVPVKKQVENYPDFETLAHVIQHGVHGFIVKNIEGESTDANELSDILWKWVCCINNFKCYQRFHKT